MLLFTFSCFNCSLVFPVGFVHYVVVDSSLFSALFIFLKKNIHYDSINIGVRYLQI